MICILRAVSCDLIWKTLCTKCQRGSQPQVNMEDIVNKMFKNPDHCQSGSQPQVNMEDIMNKMFKKC